MGMFLCSCLNASVTLILKGSTHLSQVGSTGGRPFEIHEGTRLWCAWGNWFNNKRSTCHSLSGGIINVVSVCVNNRQSVWCCRISVWPTAPPPGIKRSPSHFHYLLISSKALADCHRHSGKVFNNHQTTRAACKWNLTMIYLVVQLQSKWKGCVDQMTDMRHQPVYHRAKPSSTA